MPIALLLRHTRVLFGVLVGIADTHRPMREGAMVFLLPFMMYPAALAISAFVRVCRGVKTGDLTSGAAATVRSSVTKF